MANQRYITRTFLLSAFLILFIPLAGCRYMASRTADFCDVFQLGGGIVTEDPHGGPWPPSLGIHAQVSEFLNLGAMHYHGYSAEWDGRGFFAGPETRTRIGLGPLQMIHLDQDYKAGAENYYKKDKAWAKRMAAPKMRWWNAPAKQLNWSLYRDSFRWGTPVMHRGYQYWENIGLEVGISEPFFTHLGFTLRAGIDVSEIADFALGILCIDFKRDDLKWKEFEQLMEEDYSFWLDHGDDTTTIVKGRKYSADPLPEVEYELAPEPDPEFDAEEDIKPELVPSLPPEEE